MATKSIAAYRGYTAAAIKAKADIPNQADMTVSGTDVLCADITTAKVRAAIGAAINQVGGLGASGLVNVWSGFGPTVRSIVAQALVNAVGAAPHQEGEFAGYNHGAVTPGWKTAPDTSDIWVINGGSAEFLVDVTVGEVRWHLVTPGIVGVVFAIYDGGALVGYVARNFNDAGVTEDCTGLYAYVTCYIEKTYTCKVWLVDATASGFDGSEIVCRLPNTTDFNRTVKIKVASSWQYSETGSSAAPSGWTQLSGAAMQWTGASNGTFNIGMIASGSDHLLRIYVRVYDWLGNLVGSGYIFGASDYEQYYAATELTGLIDLGDFDTYGYICYVDFLYFT